MEEMTIHSGNALIHRTPELIAAEINNIKEQTRKMVLYNSIEIGRRLVEAKALIGHGEWGEWLEKSVDYSKSTANNLMRIFEEYGAEQITLLGDNSKCQALGNLSYTQAVALLGIPEPERENFVQEHEIESMSTRELQQAIKDREAAIKEKEEALKKLEDKQTEAEKTEEKLKKLEAEKEKLKKDLNLESSNAKAELQKREKEFKERKQELESLKKKIKELEAKEPIEVNKGATDEDIAKIKAEAQEKYEKELAVLKVEKEIVEKRVKELEIKASQQNNAAALKYSVYFDELVKNFKELLVALSEIKDTDTEAYERYKNAVNNLINMMSEKIK